MTQKYLKWVRTQDCSMCMAPGPNHAHHIRHIGHFGGVGLKANDILSMALCGRCHARMHEDPGLWVDQWEFVVRTINKGVAEGLICEVAKDA